MGDTKNGRNSCHFTSKLTTLGVPIINDIDFQIGLRAKHNEAISIVDQMSLEEKAAFCSGQNFWQLEACERLGLPSIMVTDGPHGLRKQAGNADHVGLNSSIPATCFPTACALASSWDPSLLHGIGVALGEQCIAENVAVLLGPGMNIKRHPLCGRNFEYFSEDPLLSGELAASMIQGVQSQGVGTSVKHYAVNNQEKGRMLVDAIVDERTLREVYLRGFEIAIKKAQPWTVMCAYNRLNGTYCAEHDWLLNQVLRDDWGFEGLVVTDWGATNNRAQGVSAGLDLEMPSSGGINDRRIVTAVQTGEISEMDLDRSVARTVSLILLGADLAERQKMVDQDSHHRLAHRAAIESVVLLKNDNGLLPLQETANIAVIGAFAKHPRYQGAGSSQVTPTRLDGALDAIERIAGKSASLTYAAGYDPEYSGLDADLIEQAVVVARSAEVVVVFAGLPGIFESEGFDREHMRLPEQHDQLIQAVCDANDNVVIVLCNGGPIEMPWIGATKAVLEGYLAGQAGGSAIADLLYGRANPCGKLAETFPLRQSDVPADQWFPRTGRQVQYREGLYVGYRYFDTANAAVLFPFGHGLSYTHFDYSNLTLSREVLQQNDELLVTLDVKNTGDVAGSEVVQLYVSDIESSVYRPQHELKAFTKIMLEPGETREVTLTLDDTAFAVYDTNTQGWVVEAGEFDIQVGASSRDLRLCQRIMVNSAQQVSDPRGASAGPEFLDGKLVVSDDAFAAALGKPVPPAENSRPYHINSSLSEIAETWPGGMIKRRVGTALQETMGMNTSDEINQKMFTAMINDMPLRSLALFGGGKVSFKMLNILLALLNKRFLSAIKLMLSAEDQS